MILPGRAGWELGAAARGDASLPDCQALVRDWLAGWGNQRSFHGPALIMTAAGAPALAWLVGLDDRSGRVVELAYGVARIGGAAVMRPGPRG